MGRNYASLTWSYLWEGFMQNTPACSHSWGVIMQVLNEEKGYLLPTLARKITLKGYLLPTLARKITFPS